jgi:hypothetical protein
MASPDNYSLPTFRLQATSYLRSFIRGVVNKSKIGDPAKVCSWSTAGHLLHDKKTSIVTVPLVILRTSLNPEIGHALLNSHRSCRINTVIALSLYIL